VSEHDHQYRSGEARVDLFGAAAGSIYGTSLFWISPEIPEAAVVVMAFGGYCVWRAVRGWRRPYVQLSSGRLVVFDCGRPKHYIDLAAVASVKYGFNRTVLLMKDGMKISISHMGFMFSEDARLFREALSEKLREALG
jgi:hypothetical protein